MSTTHTDISWTDATWNPVRGCSRVSPGCDNCYAMGQAHRFAGPGKPYDGLTTIRRGKVDWTGKARFIPGALTEPMRWKKPRRIFVNSMSDLFHHSLTNEEIAAVFGVMAVCPQHTFQVLTKRPDRMLEWFRWANSWAFDRVLCHADDALKGSGIAYAHLAWGGRGGRPPIWPLQNVWLGVSVEDQATADKRIPLLLETPAAVRFISAEPLLERVDLRYSAFNGADSLESLAGLDWVIVGGESGHGARPCHVQWIRSIVQQCKDASVACFVKQLGGLPVDIVGKRIALADKKGGDPAEWSEDLRVRQFPEKKQ